MVVIAVLNEFGDGFPDTGCGADKANMPPTASIERESNARSRHRIQLSRTRSFPVQQLPVDFEDGPNEIDRTLLFVYDGDAGEYRLISPWLGNERTEASQVESVLAMAVAISMDTPRSLHRSDR
ncbi:MAG: hypothetical protein PHQ28_11445 [Mycobacterium sp.]|nr:hypothetical protein [Mycobacterium sp.]